METSTPFKWRHLQPESILLCVRPANCVIHSASETWKRSCLSADCTSITPRSTALVQYYAPELEQRCRPHLKVTADSWRIDEMSVNVKKIRMYLYRAVDSAGNTLDFLLRATRDAQAAKRFFSKTLAASHTLPPRVITVDTAVSSKPKIPAETVAFIKEMAEQKRLW